MNNIQNMVEQGREKFLGVESGDLFVRGYPSKNQGGVWKYIF